MAGRPATFKQADLARALRAAKAAGVETEEIRIRGGEISIFAKRGVTSTEPSRDVLDEIERWSHED